MCMSCVSNVDALAANTMAGVVAVLNARERWSDRRQGITPLERAQRTWLRNQSFMNDLGLDPVEVLGSPPGIRHVVPGKGEPCLASGPSLAPVDSVLA